MCTLIDFVGDCSSTSIQTVTSRERGEVLMTLIDKMESFPYENVGRRIGLVFLFFFIDLEEIQEFL